MTVEHQSDQSGLHEQIQVNTASEVLKTVWEINKKKPDKFTLEITFTFFDRKTNSAHLFTRNQHFHADFFISFCSRKSPTPGRH